MSEVKKIWLVSSGAYSDYGIARVFSTKEAAEEFVRIENDHSTWSFDKPEPYGADYRVEEFDLDVPSEPRKGAWQATVWENGSGYTTWWDYAPEDRASRIAPKTSLSARSFVAYGDSREHARRAAEELRRVTLTEPFLPSGS